MIRLLNFSLFLLLALATVLPAAAGEASMTYNGINYTFYYSGSGDSAVGTYAEVSSNAYFSGAANIPSSVTYQYTYVSGYDNQGNAIYTTRNLSAPVTSIVDYAFTGCSSLTSVSIGNSVTNIGYGAFWNCFNLSSVTIGNSVANIPNNCFYRCGILSSITIPNSVKSIGDGAFNGCSSLASVIIPGSVITIGYAAFSGCSNLTSVTIPNSVTTIDDGAFSGSGLMNVTIPSSVTFIGANPFNSCKQLINLRVSNGNRVYDSRNNCNAIIETATNILISGCQNTVFPSSVTTVGGSAFSGCSNLTSVTLPNSVTSINDYAFAFCGNLTSVTIPSSVTTIGNCAFYDCSNLTSVVIPNSVTSIGNAAFQRCSSLTSVTLPNSVTSISNYTFSGCSNLTSVTIPNSVTSIGDQAFWGCSNLGSITSLADTPPTADYSSFYRCYSATLSVPAGSLDEYMTTEPWKNFYSIQPIEQEYSISLNETNAVIEKGDFVQLRATVTPDDGYAPQVTWSSSNPSVASVDEWGTVTGMGPGEAVITARAGSASATCRVKVVQHTVTLDKSSASIQLYSTLQLNATVTPHDGYEPTVVWSSSRPGVATVTQDGLVKGYMTGTATITARAGQSTATCVVTVTPILATGIALNTYQEEMTVGEVTRIIAYVAPLDVTNGNVSWSVSDNGVISASWNGNECLVIAEKAGTATVTARTTDGTNLSATCVIKVNSSEPVYIPVESITLNKSTLRMNVNTTRHLTATVLPTYASDRSVSWSSSNPNVVTVDANGAVTASRMGTAVITATTNGVTALGNHLEVKCVVTVLASGGNTDVLPGDVNGDGVVNITDVTALIRYILNGGATGIDLDNADVNQDGTINISDVTVLIRLILND